MKKLLIIFFLIESPNSFSQSQNCLAVSFEFVMKLMNTPESEEARMQLQYAGIFETIADTTDRKVKLENNMTIRNTKYAKIDTVCIEDLSSLKIESKYTNHCNHKILIWGELPLVYITPFTKIEENGQYLNFKFVKDGQPYIIPHLIGCIYPMIDPTAQDIILDYEQYSGEINHYKYLEYLEIGTYDVTGEFVYDKYNNRILTNTKRLVVQ